MCLLTHTYIAALNSVISVRIVAQLSIPVSCVARFLMLHYSILYVCGIVVVDATACNVLTRYIHNIGRGTISTHPEAYIFVRPGQSVGVSCIIWTKRHVFRRHCLQ